MKGIKKKSTVKIIFYIIINIMFILRSELTKMYAKILTYILDTERSDEYINF